MQIASIHNVFLSRRLRRLTRASKRFCVIGNTVLARFFSTDRRAGFRVGLVLSPEGAALQEIVHGNLGKPQTYDSAV